MAWNPSDKSANITLSNSNRTTTRTGAADAFYGVRSVNTAGGVKRYFELCMDEVGTSNYIVVGLANSTMSLTNSEPGADTNGWGYYQQTGQTLHNNVLSAYGSSYTTGDVIGVAYDPIDGKLWFSKNGAWQASGNPETGANPAFTGLANNLYASLSLYRSSSPAHVVTGRFVTADLSYSPPSGFLVWDEVVEEESTEYSTLQIKRGTRSQIETAKAADGLLLGEPYLITDEGRFALGTAVDEYTAFAKQSEVDAKLSITAVHLPFYDSTGTLDTIPLNSDGSLPFFDSSSAANNIPMVA